MQNVTDYLYVCAACLLVLAALWLNMSNRHLEDFKKTCEVLCEDLDSFPQVCGKNRKVIVCD